MNEDRSAWSDDEKYYARNMSSILKTTGFVYDPAAPILRATASFTVDDLLSRLRPYFCGGPQMDPLRFQTTNGEAFVLVSGIREMVHADEVEDDSFLFPRLGHGGPGMLIVEGFIAFYHPDATGRVDLDYEMSPLRLSGGSRREAFGTTGNATPESRDMYHRVLVLVAFDVAGAFYGALLQRLPSNVDQLLTLPPM